MRARLMTCLLALLFAGSAAALHLSGFDADGPEAARASEQDEALRETQETANAPAPQESACGQPAARQFDFWIGEWNVRARNRPPGSDEWSDHETWIGANVRAVLGGCAIVEESLDREGDETVAAGMSLSSYNPNLGKWQQMWVDSAGRTFEYVGQLADGKMTLHLEPTTASGERLVPFQPTTMVRMVFQGITHDGLVWTYEYSTDGGESWTATTKAVYSRRQ